MEALTFTKAFPLITKSYCIYHNDMDGKSAAYVVHKEIIEKQWGFEDVPARYQKYNYDKVSLGCIDEHTVVYIVDCAFTEDTVNILADILEKAGLVVWLDHHKSSKDLIESREIAKEVSNFIWYVDTNACGALLAYSFSSATPEVYYEMLKNKTCMSMGFHYHGFMNSTISIDVANEKEVIFSNDLMIPPWLCLVDDYDRWQNRYPDKSNFFVLGCELENNNIGISVTHKGMRRVVFNGFWGQMTTDPSSITRYINNGSVVKGYLDSRYGRELHTCFEWYCADEGVTFLCKNGTGNSWNFVDSLNEYKACCLYHYSGDSGKWVYSIYSHEGSDFNCADFCEKYGGGGHPHAAGFSLDYLLFDKPEPISRPIMD